MPSPKLQVKQETRVAKFSGNGGRSKATEPTVRGSTSDTGNTALVPSQRLLQDNPSVGQSRRVNLPPNGVRQVTAIFVPVVSSLGKPLMPCHPARARELVKEGKALRRFNKGLFYIKLTQRADGVIRVMAVQEETQRAALAIDPGSKKTGFTIRSNKHVFLNIQVDAITWVKESIATRRELRSSRRGRNTPCRQPRFNNKQCDRFLPPSTRARWSLLVRVSKWLAKVYPINSIVVEDVSAVSKKNCKYWNRNFIPLEMGKKRFYHTLNKRVAKVTTKQGWETAMLRKQYGLEKIGSKKSDSFNAHCVDSFALATWSTGGKVKPDNIKVLLVTPIQFHRRQLHFMQPSKGSERRRYGGTVSLGLKRGTWVNHPRHGTCYVGGHSENRISLHSIETGARLSQMTKVDDCTPLCYSSWRVRWA